MGSERRFDRAIYHGFPLSSSEMPCELPLQCLDTRAGCSRGPQRLGAPICLDRTSRSANSRDTDRGTRRAFRSGWTSYQPRVSVVDRWWAGRAREERRRPRFFLSRRRETHGVVRRCGRPGLAGRGSLLVPPFLLTGGGRSVYCRCFFRRRASRGETRAP